MDRTHTYLLANFYSETITEYLGVFAILAFTLTICGVLFTLSKGATLKQKSKVLESAAVSNRIKSEEEADATFKNDVEEYDRECAEFFVETVDSCRIRLKELVSHARSALGVIDAQYANHAKVQKGETLNDSRGRYRRVCETQWIYLKSELGYVGFKELEPYIYRALDVSALEDVVETPGMEDDISELDQRNLEIRLMRNSLSEERFGSFYHEYLAGVDGYKSFFKMHIKEWIGELSFEVVRKLRFKSRIGVTINETEQKAKLVRLKNVLDVVDRLCERLESNSTEVGDEDAAFMQIIFGGVVLGIISELPSWFQEVGDLVSEQDSGSLASV